MYRRLNIENNINVANCLFDIGNAYVNLNDFDKGLKFSLEAIEIYQKLNITSNINMVII